MLDPITLEIGKIYKTESSRILAGLIRILGDLDLAEEALQEAFSIAIKKWPIEGIPENPCSWLISAGKFKAIDSIRKTTRANELNSENAKLKELLAQQKIEQSDWDNSLIEDDQLRLIFYCCHPLLPLDSQIALSLKEVCAMSVLEISRAFLLTPETVKKRITRAKALIKQNKIPYEIPSQFQLQERMDAVLRVIYLIFNEGYSASVGEQHIRKELMDEGIFLGRKLVELNPTPESMGLLALLILQTSRRNSRVTKDGDLIPLEAQDRSKWDYSLINEGVHLIHAAVMSGRLGPYTLQAAIASVHALADSVDKTQWDLIVQYYDILLSINPSPIVELNRAIAVGMHEGPQFGLKIIDELMDNEKLQNYHILYAVKADFSKKLGLTAAAIQAYQRAIELVTQEPEARFLKKQLDEIQ